MGGSENHIPKQNAFSPTGKKPAENTASGDISSVFSTERDEPILKFRDVDDVNEKVSAETRTRHRNGTVPMSLTEIKYTISCQNVIPEKQIKV